MLKSQGTGYRKEGIHFLDFKKSLSEMTEGAVHQGFVLRVSEFAYELDHILAKHDKKKILCY